MDMIPVSDLISLFLAFCGGISIIGAAAAYVAKAVGWLKRPEEKQNEILQDHEKRIARLEEKTDNDYSDIRKLQQEMKMMLRAVVAIMKHEIDGNNTADLKKEQEAIDDYLFEK
jgi:hypothetical protein